MTMNKIQNNKRIGTVAETIALSDFENNGFMTFKSLRSGFDFIGLKVDTQNRISQLMIVEVKKIVGPGNVRPLSKVQQSFKRLCKLTHVDHLTYFVTEDQISYWLSQNQTITLDQFMVDSTEDGSFGI